MSDLRWCSNCQDYIGKLHYNEHMKQHSIGNPNVEHKQFSGQVKDESDYMICILHQKKVPCPVKHCKYQPFGMIRKSVMIKCAKGIIGDPKKINDPPEPGYMNNPNRKVAPYFPHCDFEGNQVMIPIDMKTRTVILNGATIHLRI